MRKLFYISQTLLLLAFANHSAKAQAIDSLLTLQRAADPQEKMYVHFDKGFYGPGETIWFKAYLFAGLERSLASKNFYAELRDENGNLIDKKTAPIIVSGAASSFDLPATFSKKTVYFRAYTTTMLNGDTSFLYVKPIRIIVPPATAAAAAATGTAKKTPAKPAATTPVASTPANASTVAANASPEISFLPEGGDLVSGLIATVAFKATNGKGDPQDVTGFVKGPDGTKLVEFTSLHDGMGSFPLMPEAGKTYTAVWKDDKKKEYTTNLPAIKPNGIGLHISSTENGKRFALQRQATAADNYKSLTVIAVMSQQLVYQARINLSVKTEVSAVIPTQEMGTGILQITVFDADMHPVAERICFVNNNNYELDGDAWISELNNTKRGLNRAEVKIGDSITANLSLSITDADLLTSNPNDDNIVTRMLFTGDLRGKIHNPYYYFFSTSDSASYHLDLVMLTNGWRRYNWDNVLAGKIPTPKYKEPNYLAIAGTVAGSKGSFNDGLELTGMMRLQDSSSSFISVPVDKKGEVMMDGLVFYDTARLYLKFNQKNKYFDANMFAANNGLLQTNNNVGLALAIKEKPEDVDTALIALNAKKNAEEIKVAAKRFKDAHELGNVTVRAKAKTNIQKLDEQYTNGLFSGGDAIQLDVMNDPFAASSFSIFQYLQGKVAGLQITMGGSNGATLSWRGGSPALYLDEMQSDAQMLSGISMNDVAYIKIFRPGTAGAVYGGGGGVISVYTKRGGDVKSNVPSELSMIKLVGYSTVKQFYAPDYSADTNPDAFYDNYSTTLFWEPFLVLDKTKKRQKIQFYNNDITKRFRIVLEGIDEFGRLIHIEKIAEK